MASLSVDNDYEQRAGIVIHAVLPYDASAPDAEQHRRTAKDMVTALRNFGFSCHLIIPGEEEQA
jgi:hypothetical protein